MIRSRLLVRVLGEKTGKDKKKDEGSILLEKTKNLFGIRKYETLETGNDLSRRRQDTEK